MTGVYAIANVGKSIAIIRSGKSNFWIFFIGEAFLSCTSLPL